MHCIDMPTMLSIQITKSALFCLYDHAFKTPSLESVGNSKHDHNIICAAVVLYNVSLSYQLAMLSGSMRPRKFLETSLKLYQMSLKLIESLADDSQQYYHTTKLVLAIVNSMGHICSGFSNLEAMQVCHDCIVAHYHDLVSYFDFYSETFTHAGSGMDTDGSSYAEPIRHFSLFVFRSPQDCLIAGAAA
jgi:hypothetical protein